MAEYLLSITGVVLISSILTNIMPTGKTSALIRGIVRLCLYLLILSPVYEFVQKRFLGENDKIFQNYFSETVIETDTEYIEYCSEKSIEYVEEMLEKQVLQEHGEVVEIELVLDRETKRKQDVKILFLKLFCGATNEVKAEEIRNDLSEEFQVEVRLQKGE
jgi:hypothetical protein